jgi:heme/copper-type cytochrome/quinol oxidase subunit 2
MWVWEVVWVVIPLVAIIGSFISKWHTTNAKVALAQAGNTEAMQELRDVVLRLESRVSNLERAVMTAETDRKYAL